MRIGDFALDKVIPKDQRIQKKSTELHKKGFLWKGMFLMLMRMACYTKRVANKCM